MERTLASGGLAAGLERDRGEAGDEHHPHVGRDRGRLLGELDAVHLGHDDVGQQQVELLALEQRQRGGAAIDRVDLIADPLERARQIDAHRIVVFGQQDPHHRRSAAGAPRRRRASLCAKPINIFQPRRPHAQRLRLSHAGPYVWAAT